MARARRVDVDLGDGSPDADARDGDGPEQRGPAGRRRWWLAVPVVAVLALVVGQVVTDTRERTDLADLARQPLVVDPVEGPVEVAWQVPRGTQIASAARAGSVLVAARVTPDLAVALEGVDVATGAGLWSSEVVAARPDLGEDAVADPVVCVPAPDDERQVACLVPDSAWSVVDGAPVTVAATTTRLLVLDAADGTVRVDREVPTWAQWLTPVGDDVLLVGDLHGTLTAELQALRDGATRWRTTSERKAGGPSSRVLPVTTVLDEETIAVDRLGEVVFLSATNGEELGSVVSGLDVGGDGQLVTFTATMSIALGAALVFSDAGTQVATPGRAVSVEGVLPQVLVDDGSVPGLVLTRTPRLTAWDADDGTERWATDVVDAEDVTVFDGRVHVGTSTDLVTFDGATGDELWRFDRPSAEGTPVTDGRYLYTTARRGERHSAPYDLVALHPADGSEAWRAPLPERSWPQSVAGLLVATSFGPNIDDYEEIHQVLRGRG
ncbi:hypothetical protein Cfla_0063 [Cellulomonas flavigena DSM 20109]|uniref:Pyrrolo-quinoline quinone repeat domain-containing protein n=1 Tax=Cellulomonas flavigena (strain ATCC 482 / DSM 20109 / BCRC 11376 / JCM 18109 / NBRC 3775 / NCIMB 8073 / NRS 134) TaxID=446466 RepID=D5UFM4_CELFN|nr:PQQ-binding-like beta-propeller repeat protein [Cellulomonas flavigena]ADG72983.1 hypothetical protein Cfla_0063 [Cellulomonas flavigena DSM 20109]